MSYENRKNIHKILLALSDSFLEQEVSNYMESYWDDIVKKTGLTYRQVLATHFSLKTLAEFMDPDNHQDESSDTD